MAYIIDAKALVIIPTTPTIIECNRQHFCVALFSIHNGISGRR